MTNKMEEEKWLRSLSEDELLDGIIRMMGKDMDPDCALMKELERRVREVSSKQEATLRTVMTRKVELFKRACEKKMLLDAWNECKDRFGLARLENMGKVLEYHKKTVRDKLQKYPDLFWIGSNSAMRIFVNKTGESER